MSKKSRAQRIQETVLLLQAIDSGQKHTRANKVLAPLSQADLIRYDSDPVTHRATTVRLTTGGKSYLRVYAPKIGQAQPAPAPLPGPKIVKLAALPIPRR